MRAIGRRTLTVVLVAALALTGCGGDEGDEDVLAAPPEAPTQTAAPTPTPTPAPAQQVYVVQQGDTLGAIAVRFGTTVAAIVEASGLDDPDRLAIGDELVIPVAPGVGPEPTATPTPDPDATAAEG
jgi:LysM repeat protein